MRGLGDPDAFPATDLGVLLAAKQVGLPEDARALTEHSARWRPWRSYAAQHLWTALDHAVNAVASEGEVMSAIQFRTVDSPVGLLTLAGRDGRLMHLRMVDQTYEPSHDGWERDDDGVSRRRRPARVVLRRRTFRVRPRTRPGRHAVSAQRLGGTADHPVRRDPVLRRDRGPDRLAGSIPRSRVWPTATTRSASSCPAIG